LVDQNENEMGGAHIGERRCVYRVWVGKPEGMRTLGRHNHRWEDNIKLNLLDVRWGSMDWTDLTQDTERQQAIAKW
jgi:hypothetical protein